MNFDDIAELTDNNMHTMAYIAGCVVLDEIAPEMEVDVIIRSLRGIEDMHRKLGYLPSELSGDRYELYLKMIDTAKYVLGEEDFKKFYSCF